jgi:acyl-CoA thioester hydrolase
MLLVEGEVRPDWIDYNGHLYDGYYAVIFAHAADAFLDLVGLDHKTRQETHHTIYTLETHVCFLREMKLGVPFTVEGQIIEHDHKRVRLFLTMRDTQRGIIAATSEELLMSIDQSGEEPRSAPWLARTAAIIQELAAADAARPVPEAAGRGISIRR